MDSIFSTKQANFSNSKSIENMEFLFIKLGDAVLCRTRSRKKNEMHEKRFTIDLNFFKYLHTLYGKLLPRARSLF